MSIEGGDSLLAEVLCFIARWHLSERQFGCMAVGSPALMSRLRKDRIRPRTVERVRGFIARGNPRGGSTRSRFARRYAATVQRNARLDRESATFRRTDSVEQAKTYMRRQHFNCFDASVTAIRTSERRQLAGKIAVVRRSGTTVYESGEFIDLARKMGWNG